MRRAHTITSTDIASSTFVLNIYTVTVQQLRTDFKQRTVRFCDDSMQLLKLFEIYIQRAKIIVAVDFQQTNNVQFR